MNDPLMSNDPQQPHYQPPVMATPAGQSVASVVPVVTEPVQPVATPQAAIPWKKILLWSGVLNASLLVLGTGLIFLFGMLWGLFAPRDGLAGIFLGMAVVSAAGPAIAGILTWLLGFWIFKKAGLRYALLFSFAMLMAAGSILSAISAFNPLSTGTWALMQLVSQGNFIAIAMIVGLSLLAGIAGAALTAWVMYSLKGRVATWARVVIFILAIVAVQAIGVMAVVLQGS